MNGSSKILIVDDTPVNIDVLKRALEREGYEISMAPSGEIALKLVSRVDPDLILLDVMMPGMDGFETCRKIKEDQALKDIPVIFITGKTGEEDVIEGLKAGGVDYVPKPFRHDEVIARVRTQIRLREADRKNRELVQQLKDALTKMEDAKQEKLAKVKFLARMSHEWRTPLNSIMGFTQLLELNRNGHLDQMELEQVEEIKKAGQHLLNMIDKTLDYATLEEETLSFMLKPVVIGSIVNDVLSGLETHAKAKGLSFETNMNGSGGKTVSADPMRLKQILEILVTNAIEYNSENGRVSLESKISLDGKLIVSVKDNGPGIPEINREKIFEPLFRQPEHLEMVDGIGMGLACARKYASMMGASISVVDNPGGGSCFNLEIPMATN